MTAKEADILAANDLSPPVGCASTQPRIKREIEVAIFLKLHKTDPHQLRLAVKADPTLKIHITRTSLLLIYIYR